jgi:hypothetical protein
VLRVGRDELGEGGEETVDPGAGHGAELPGQERWEGQRVCAGMCWGRSVSV